MQPVLMSRATVKSVIGAGAIVACLVVTAGRMVAAPQPSGGFDQAVVGEPTRFETTLDANAETVVLARAGKVRDALGFPVGAKHTSRHVRDGFEQAEYDEVSEVDAAGRITSITQFDGRGQLRAAIRLDSAPRAGLNVTRKTAIDSARRSALAAGLAVDSPSGTEVDQANGGWTIRWARLQDGIRVRDDETLVHLWSDGRIQSLARVVHDLASPPDRRIGSDQARQVVGTTFDQWFAGRNSGYTIQSVGLEWVGPNGVFDPARITDSPQPYRLAWVANVKPTGTAANYVWLITVYVDAGDGTIIGGYVVE
jgi:hypothetical protein